MKLTCDTCGFVHDVPRTNEIPTHVISMNCNWGPKCEDRAENYYEERYNEDDQDGNVPTPTPDNQLCMPFIFDEIGIHRKKDLADSKKIVP